MKQNSQQATGSGNYQAQDHSHINVYNNTYNNIYSNLPPYTVSREELTAARERLDAMPLEEVPAVAALPSVSRMRLTPNPNFVGREQHLMDLAKALKQGTTTAIGPVAAATGIGGIGKTQLAVEFAHRYGQYFAGGVFWLSFADPAAISAELADCGGAGRLALRADYANLPLDEQVRLVLSAFQSQLPRLLVFDNCEHQALLSDLRPPSGGCRVIVTSRREQWAPDLAVRPVRVGTLTRPQSIELLRRYRSDLLPDDTDLSSIADDLGYFPLALSLAGNFLHTFQHAPFGTPAAYLHQLRTSPPLQHPSLHGEGADYSPTRHDLDVAKTFDISYRQLDPALPLDQLALQLLARASCFAPGEPIPRDLLIATLGLDAEDMQAMLQAEKALARLTGLGLLETEAGGALRLHRLLMLFVHDVGPNTGAQDAVELAFIILAYDLNMQGFPAALLPIQTHLRHVTDTASTRQDEQAATLCHSLGYHLNMLGAYTDARTYLERDLSILEKVLPPDHPDIALSLNNLGSLLQDQGDYAAARTYLERALSIREKVLPPDHPDIALSLNNLGALLQAQGDYAAARTYLERALSIWEKVLPLDHPNIATSLNNLGLLSYYQGDFQAASDLVRRALSIVEKALGPNHPDTQSARSSLATIQQRLQQTQPGAEAHQAPSEQPTPAELAASIAQQAEQAVAAALVSATPEQQAQLAAQLEQVAQQAEEGEEHPSPYLELAARLRALASQLASSASPPD